MAALPGSISGTVERGATFDDWGKSPTRINKKIAQNSNFTVTLPSYCRIDSFVIAETAGNAVTGGINVGTVAGGNDVLWAFPVGATSWTQATGASILRPLISPTLDTTLYVSPAGAWHGAVVDFAMTFTDMQTV